MVFSVFVRVLDDVKFVLFVCGVFMEGMILIYIGVFMLWFMDVGDFLFYTSLSFKEDYNEYFLLLVLVSVCVDVEDLCLVDVCEFVRVNFFDGD